MQQINGKVPEAIADPFRETAPGHGHKKELGVAMAAAFLAFMKLPAPARIELMDEAASIKRKEQSFRRAAAADEKNAAAAVLPTSKSRGRKRGGG